MDHYSHSLSVRPLKRCSRCLLPETQETITYDAAGVCNVCRNHEFKKERIDWEARERDFHALLDDYRGKYDYDCIVPFSGGKDSTWTLYSLVTKFKLKPLVVSFDHGFMRPNLIENNERTFRTLGVDVLKFRPSWTVVKRLMRESLLRKGDFCWHCHTGIFAYPMQIAVKHNVPLVIWGEPSAEYTAYYGYDEIEEADEKRFNRWINLGITADDMHGMIADGAFELRDLAPFAYPPLRDLRRIKCRSVCLGSYQPWDTKTQSDIISRELGWRGDEVEGVPGQYGYEKIECAMQGVRDYLKFLKRGFGRTAHLMSLDLRNGRITQEEAQKLIDGWDGKRPASLDVFLETLEMSEEEFHRIALTHVIAPHFPDLMRIQKGKPLWDQSHWLINADKDRTKQLRVREPPVPSTAPER